MHDHLEIVATCRARREWRRMGALSVDEAKSFLVTSMRRRWATAMRRANSRLRFRTALLVGWRGRAAQGLGREAVDDVGAPGLFDAGVHADVGGGGGGAEWG